MGTSDRTAASIAMCFENPYTNPILRHLWDEGCDRGIRVAVMTWAEKARDVGPDSGWSWLGSATIEIPAEQARDLIAAVEKV